MALRASFSGTIPRCVQGAFLTLHMHAVASLFKHPMLLNRPFLDPACLLFQERPSASSQASKKIAAFIYL